MIAIYSRQSVEKRDSISIESQIDFCKREFIEGEEYKTYIDKGYSGKDTHRPAFEEMIKDVKQGLIERVIVYKLDRISRSVLDFSNIMDIFEKYNVSFTSSTEKFDTSTPIGMAMLSIIVVFAQLERQTIQIRIKDNYYARGKRGFFMGGRPPYGFNKVAAKIDGKKTSTFEPDINQMPHLIKMFDMYAYSNKSLGNISDYLNENNVPSAENKKWDSGKISRLLRSPVYVKADADVYQYYKNKGCIISNDISDFIGTNGCYLYGKRESNERKYTNVENHVLSIGLHDGIIDSRTWLLCQYKLDENKQIKNTNKGRNSWLTNVKCGMCGYAVSVIKSGHGVRYKYFNCRGKTNLKVCDGHKKPIRVDDVENDIKSFIIQKAQELSNTNIDITNNQDSHINKTKLRIMDIDNQIENLIKQMSEANNVVMKYINEKVTTLDLEKNSLLEEMKKISISNSKALPMKQMIDKVKDWDKLDFEEKKSLCSFFISKIKIFDGNTEIKWNF